MHQRSPDEQAESWAAALASRPRRLIRPTDVPRPESADEVARWAGREDLRRTQLVYAPVFWVVLPLAAATVLVWGTITDPGAGWTGDLFDSEADGQPWNFWLVWVAVGVWLLIAVGVLVLRLSVLRTLRVENQWVFERGVAHSIHRTAVDRDDGEGRWATYVAIDHRVDDRRAARIHAAFEHWLAQEGPPASGSAPLSSTALFGAQAAGGYFLPSLPVSETSGETTTYEWMLITPPGATIDETIVTPVPRQKHLQRLRRLRRATARRAGPGPEPASK